MRIALSVTLTLSACLFHFSASAGWMETHADGKVIVYAEGQIKKAAPEDPTWSTVGLADQSLLIVHSDRRVYAQGTIDDYCRAMETFLRSVMAEMAPEERELMDELMDEDAHRDDQRPRLIIGRAAEAGPVAGLATEKYLVLVDGKLYEELWLAPAAPIMQELDSAAIRNVERKMTTCMENITEIVTGNWLRQPEQDAAYQELLHKGWLMRRISYSGGMPLTEMLVTALEGPATPTVELHPPQNFLQISFEELIFEE
jgi:hypothetical protein